MVGSSRAFNSFTCPNCQALYQIVKVEAGPETDSREIVCRACGGPLVGRAGKFVLKYFLCERPRAVGDEPRGHSTRFATRFLPVGPLGR
jgi:hypothetical protein